MGEIGTGVSVPSWPATLDTDTTKESSATTATSTFANDIAAIAIQLETILGTNPHGSVADVKTYLQTEHNADGTHGTVTISGTLTAATISGDTRINGGVGINVAAPATDGDLTVGNDLIVIGNMTGGTIDATVTVADGALSSNVVLENIANIFTADQKISKTTPILRFQSPANSGWGARIVSSPAGVDEVAWAYDQDVDLYKLQDLLGGNVTRFSLNRNTGDVVATGTIFAQSSDDVDLAGISGALIIGGDGTGSHIAIDADEIQAKGSATTTSALNLQALGGTTSVGGAFYVGGVLRAENADDVDLASVSGALIVGGDGTGAHIAIDGDEIQAKGSATTASQININALGGGTLIGGGLGVGVAPPATGEIKTAGDIDCGGIFKGGTLAPTLLSAGAIPSGVTIDAARITSGTVPSPVVVPLARIQRTEASAEASGVTITDGLGDTITTVDLGTVNAGDRILVSYQMRMMKGGTAGDSETQIGKSTATSTADVVFFNSDFHAVNTLDGHAAFSAWEIAAMCIAKVTVSGTLVLRLQANSEGSNGTASGQLHAIVLNNG